MKSLFLRSFRGAFASSRRTGVRVSPRRARPNLEHLEDRMVPTVFHVNSLADLSLATGVNPATGAINGTDHTVTLRSAIEAANATPGSNSPASAAAANQRAFTFSTIDFAGDTFTQLLGVNNSLTIAGYHGAVVNKGFVLRDGSFTNENFPNSVQTQVVGINNRGTTVGFFIDNAGMTHGFEDHDGKFTTVDFPGTTFNQLLGVNDHDVAAGYFMDAAGVCHGYTVNLREHSFTELPIPFMNQATGVNDRGDVSGFFVDNAGKTHGYLFKDNVLQTIDFPGSTSTQAFGLNAHGQVVGAYVDAAGAMHGFELSKGQFQSIDDPFGVGTTLVNGINDFGALVGFYVDAAGNTNGFLAIPKDSGGHLVGADGQRITLHTEAPLPGSPARGEQLEHAREGAHAARDWVFALGGLDEGYLRPRYHGFSNT